MCALIRPTAVIFLIGFHRTNNIEVNLLIVQCKHVGWHNYDLFSMWFLMGCSFGLESDYQWVNFYSES